MAPEQPDNYKKSVPDTNRQSLGGELRSDAVRRGAVAVNIQKPARGQWQLFLLVGGVVVLLALLGGGIYFLMRPVAPLQVGSGEENGGLFGNLPLANNQESAASGLSGRTCEDAKRRPLGVMLSSDPITRPVSGFADADMVFELPVLVNDVTRLLAIYQCGRPADIGSVRSARHDYLFLAEGADAIVGHWGGSYHALNRIGAGEFQTIDALGNPFQAYFRKNNLPAPYNGFTTYEGLWGALQKLTYRTTTTFEGYSFKDDPAASQRPTGGKLSIAWPGAFRVHYEYDPATNRYRRFWGGAQQMDGGTKQPVTPSVVAIMRATNQSAQGPGGYNEMSIEGEGVLEVYQDGQVIRGTWRKDEFRKQDPVHFLDGAGKPIVFTRGQVWVMAVEPHIEVKWEAAGQASPTP